MNGATQPALHSSFPGTDLWNVRMLHVRDLSLGNWPLWGYSKRFFYFFLVKGGGGVLRNERARIEAIPVNRSSLGQRVKGRREFGLIEAAQCAQDGAAIRRGIGEEWG